MPTELATSVARARESLEWLQRWLVNDAYPFWAQHGYDTVQGGFHETLGSDGPVANEPRRARVQLRQIYSFARAADFGWRENAPQLVRDGLDYFFKHYRRGDGLFRTLVAPDGAVLDESALLYDQAFVLLALAESHRILGRTPELVQAARALRTQIYARLKCPGPGFRSGVPAELPLLANPHMHLLEAALRWTALSDEPAWAALAEEIVALALDRLIDGRTGAVLEYFDENWLPLAKRSVEPGHQFEWAWLLLCWRERAKPRYWSMTDQAAAGLRRYLETGVAGLWYDRLLADGQFVQESSPASSFYHIVCAIGALEAAFEGP